MLMIYFSYFCKKNWFLFWARYMQTCFFDKFGPKIKVFGGFANEFQHFIESYQKAKWLWFRYKIWAKLVPML